MRLSARWAGPGFVAEWHGQRQLAVGRPPELFGQAGVMKLAHGMPMHAIQILPLIALGLRLFGVDEQSRLGSVCSACTGFFGLTAFGMLQTFTGRDRFDLTALSACVLVVSTMLLGLPAVTAAHGLIRSRRRPPQAN